MAQDMSAEHLPTLIAISFYILLSLVADLGTAQRNDPEDFYTTIELVCAEGYSIQEYKVQTEDGYRLTIHRIPNRKRRPKVTNKTRHYQKLHNGYHPDFAKCFNESAAEKANGPPVLLAHGVFSASDNYLLQGAGYDLAYILLEKGYDIWMTNTRGNFYSREHVSLNPSDPKFWDFSFHENGIYDLPAIIDFILNTTGYTKLTYVGHSMGTTMFFVLTTTKPEYNEKINLFVGMAPLGQLKLAHFSSAKRGALGAGYNIVKEMSRQGVNELGPRSSLPAILSRYFCAAESPLQNLCYDFFFSFLGYHSKLFLRKKFTSFMCHSFSGSSVKAIVHYHQLFRSPTFRQFDYGPEENFRRYGQAEPLDYDLRKVTAPVALYYSNHDNIVAAQDVQLLINILPNIVETQRFPKLNHIDFLWAYNAKDLIYSKILALIDKSMTR